MERTPGQTRVFVVDDEANIAFTLAAILRIHGFDARHFTEPHAAMSAARLDCPDLLISDVVMPLLSGIELAIQMRECCPECRILLFSGQPLISICCRAPRTMAITSKFFSSRCIRMFFSTRSGRGSSDSPNTTNKGLQT